MSKSDPQREMLFERVAGMLAGVAVGDALGMPVEFLTRDQIRTRYGVVQGFLQASPQHPHHTLPAGSVTDDSDHTWILAKLILRDGVVTSRAFAEELLAWGSTPRVQQNRFIGPSTQKALQALKNGVPLEKLPRSGTSVGAAMRTAALAVAFPDLETLTSQVVASCSLSHYTHNAISGAMSMAYALSAALEQDASLDSVQAAAQAGAVAGRRYGNWSWTPPIEKRIDFACRWTTSQGLGESLQFLADIIGVDLYPEQLVPSALALMILSDGDPMQAMRLACSLGGDTDTLASMTGSICGALKGWSAFDAGMLETVDRLNHLELRQTAAQLVDLRLSSRSNHN